METQLGTWNKTQDTIVENPCCLSKTDAEDCIANESISLEQV